MTTKTKKTTSAKQKASAVLPSSFGHRLDALLHTMRCIAQYEDALCELAHEVKRTGTLSPEATNTLRDILESIPTHDFVLDLDAVSDMLAPSLPPPSQI
jgi:hypothetical protein